MVRKSRKTLYLPDWVIKRLDAEGEIADGPGLVAAAAIFHFCNKKHDEKRDMLKAYLTVDIDSTYGCRGAFDAAEHAATNSAGKDENVAAQRTKVRKRKSRQRKPSKSG